MPREAEVSRPAQLTGILRYASRDKPRMSRPETQFQPFRTVAVLANEVPDGGAGRRHWRRWAPGAPGANYGK